MCLVVFSYRPTLNITPSCSLPAKSNVLTSLVLLDQGCAIRFRYSFTYASEYSIRVFVFVFEHLFSDIKLFAFVFECLGEVFIFFE